MSDKWKVVKASRATYKTERDAIAFLSTTKRGKKMNLAKCNKRHSNYEWIFREAV